MHAQTKCYEDVAGEGPAYAASGKVAGELRGMLEGSAQTNARKGGVGAPACISCVPQVCSTGFHDLSLDYVLAATADRAN